MYFVFHAVANPAAASTPANYNSNNNNGNDSDDDETTTQTTPDPEKTEKQADKLVNMYEWAPDSDDEEYWNAYYTDLPQIEPVSMTRSACHAM